MSDMGLFPSRKTQNDRRSERKPKSCVRRLRPELVLGSDIFSLSGARLVAGCLAISFCGHLCHGASFNSNSVMAILTGYR